MSKTQFTKAIKRKWLIFCVQDTNIDAFPTSIVPGTNKNEVTLPPIKIVVLSGANYCFTNTPKLNFESKDLVCRLCSPFLRLSNKLFLSGGMEFRLGSRALLGGLIYCLGPLLSFLTSPLSSVSTRGWFQTRGTVARFGEDSFLRRCCFRKMWIGLMYLWLGPHK